MYFGLLECEISVSHSG